MLPLKLSTTPENFLALKTDPFFFFRKRESVEETIDDGIKLRNKNRARLSEYQNIPTFMTEPEAVLEYSKGSRRDKKPPKLPSLSNIESFDTSTSPQQLSPMSPVTPAGGCKFNLINSLFPYLNFHSFILFYLKAGFVLKQIKRSFNNLIDKLFPKIKLIQGLYPFNAQEARLYFHTYLKHLFSFNVKFSLLYSALN